MGIAWATHTVHHSSPYFNISVAYRFGPLDGFFPLFFHLPLVLAGFNPILVFFSEAVVQLYQTARGLRAKVGYLLRPPGWTPERTEAARGRRRGPNRGVAVLMGKWK